jgi:hypothetical protein
MNARSLLVVAAVAVVSIVLAIVGQRQSTDETTAGSLLLPGLTESLNDVARVVVTGAGAKTVATLVRTETGWSVAEKDGYPADIAKIRQTLVSLGEARLVEEKTSNPAFHARLGVEAIEAVTAGGVAIAIEAPANFPVLILGDEPNSASRYVRRATEETSFLIDRNPDVPRTAVQWLVPDIMDVRGARLQNVTIAHQDGERLVISKASADESNFAVADVPEGRELLYPGAANVIGNALRELKLDDVAREGTDATEPAAVTEFRTFDGLVVTVTGTPHEDATWLTFAARTDPELTATLPPSPEAAADAAEAPDVSAEAASINARVAGWRYRIPAHQYDQLTRRLADLLKAPE